MRGAVQRWNLAIQTGPDSAPVFVPYARRRSSGAHATDRTTAGSGNSTRYVATSWVDLQAVWGKGQLRVGTAIHHVRQRLPMPLRGVDSDNGSEFINHGLYAWCQREGVTLAELKEKMNFANGRQIRDDEEMRVVHFRVVQGKVKL